MKKSFFTSAMFICLVFTMTFLTLTLVSFAAQTDVGISIFYATSTLTMAMMLPSCSTNK